MYLSEIIQRCSELQYITLYHGFPQNFCGFFDNIVAIAQEDPGTLRLRRSRAGQDRCVLPRYLYQPSPEIPGRGGAQVTLVMVLPQRGHRLPPEAQVVPQWEHCEQVPVRTGFTGPQA